MNTRYLLILAFCCLLSACSGGAGNSNTAANGNIANASAGKNIAATNAGTKEAYPESVKDEFLKSCVAAGSQAMFCACVFEKVQNKYSFEEFSVIESKISAGNTPEDFAEFSGKARAECTKSN